MASSLEFEAVRLEPACESIEIFMINTLELLNRTTQFVVPWITNKLDTAKNVQQLLRNDGLNER